MATIVLDSLLSFNNNQENYHTAVKVQCDKISGGIEVVRGAAKELESFKNLTVFPLVDIPTNGGWSAGYYIITGEFTPESVPFRDCPKAENTVTVRFSVGNAAHVDSEGKIDEVHIGFDFYSLYQSVKLIGQNTFAKVNADLTNESFQRAINPTIAEGDSETIDKLTKSIAGNNISELETLFEESYSGAEIDYIKKKSESVAEVEMAFKMSEAIYNYSFAHKFGKSFGVTQGTCEVKNPLSVFDDKVEKRCLLAFFHIYQINSETNTIVNGWGISTRVDLFPKFTASDELPSLFPIEASKVTPEWLTKALHENKKLSEDVSITSVTSRSVGDIHGYAGVSALLDLTFSNPDFKEFTSLFMKASVDRASPYRSGIKQLYEREWTMYNHVVPITPGLAEPYIYYKNYDVASGDCLLVMKNLNGDYKVGDQLNSCSVPVAKSILTEVAKLHGFWWEHERIQPGGDLHEKLPNFPFFDPAMRAGFLVPCFSIFYDEFPMSSELKEFLQKELEPRVASIYSYYLTATKTIAHNDFRLDNLFIKEESAAEDLPPIILIDYQISSIQSFHYDIGNFITGNLSIEDVKNHGKELVQHYAEEVIRFGAKATVEEIADSFYLLLVNGILSSIGIFASVLVARKTGKPVEERLEKFLNKWVYCALAAAEHFELAEHPESLANIPLDEKK